MTDYKQDQDFARDVFGTVLQDVIEWIKGNMYPEDIFTEDELGEWAKANGFREDD